MKTKFKMIFLILISTLTFAKQLDNVNVLDITQDEDKFVLKLQDSEIGGTSFFIVEINKSDKESFVKLDYLIKKIKNKENYKLNLEIPSFSAYPSGSFYKSENVKFSGE